LRSRNQLSGSAAALNVSSMVSSSVLPRGEDDIRISGIGVFAVTAIAPEFGQR
jgi:hypothetical protein